MADDYAELVKRLDGWVLDLQVGRKCFGADQDVRSAADAIEALVKERNQIAMELAVNGNSADRAWRAGREAGIREAAEAARRYTVVADQKFDDVLAKAQAGVKNLSLAGACATGMMHMAEGIERAILALLEKEPAKGNSND